MKDVKEMSKSAIADLELVNAIKSEDKRKSEKAFSLLFKKYHDTMLFHFRGLVKDEEDAKEIVLEAFVKVSSNIEKFNQDSAVFSTWLFRLTQNLFIDKLRKKKDDVVSLSDMATYDEDSHTFEFDFEDCDGTPESKILDSEKERRVNEVLSKMENQELAEMIKMRYFQGLSYEEISNVTGKPLGTIKAFIFRAKQFLKKDLKRAKLNF
jgi:RNA polymerase sigma-70 factor (ECF subfamily)